MLFEVAFLCIAAFIVVALSLAEIPVVTPSAASIDTVKLVPKRVSFSWTIKGNSSILHFSSVSVRQIRPRPNLDIKLIWSELANSAARTRSPSFSLFSSSTRITILPCLISSIISTIGRIIYSLFSFKYVFEISCN